MPHPSVIYLDHCGSTPLSKEVQARMTELVARDFFGNPTASHHVIGAESESLLSKVRAEIAHELGALPSQLLFTSGATEANNLVLWGFSLRHQGRNPLILYGATEHKSIFDTCQAIAAAGLARTEEIPVTSVGEINMASLESALARAGGSPVLVAIMHINNEIPARNAVEEIAGLCRQFKASFHCDGVQGFVRESLDFSRGLYGSYVISPHKFYGPKGVGILLLGTNPLAPRIKPAYRGGEQENGMRPGTHNLIAIAASAVAVNSHNKLRPQRITHMRACASAFTASLTRSSTNISLTVPLQDAAPGIVNFFAENLDAPTLLENIPTVCLSRGASCIGSGGEKFSHVPKALGLPVEIQANVLRASFGEHVTIEQSARAGETIANAIKKLKGPH